MPTPAPLHYTWIGPKPSKAYLGHDTIGPDMMRDKYPDQPIHYWCLEKHAENYRKYFTKRHKGKKRIEVHPIEPFVADRFKDFSDFILLLLDTAEKHLSPVERIREYVTIKDCFQYFLQQHEYGYFIDTNVIPNPEMDPSESSFIPNLNYFSFPMIISSVGKTEKKIPDPWLMYSCEGDPYARLRFFHIFSEVQDEYKARGMDKGKINSKWLCRAFTKAAYDNFGETNRIDVKHPMDSVRILHFQKRYYNTHRRSVVPFNAHYSLLEENTYQEFEYLLRLGEMEPSTIYSLRSSKDKVREITLIHEAIRLNKPRELLLCLSMGSNSDVALKINKADDNAMTPLSYAIKMSAVNFRISGCIDTILRFEQAKHFSSESEFVEQLKKMIEVIIIGTVFEPDVAVRLVSRVASIEDLVAMLQDDKQDLIEKAVNLVIHLGPLSAQTIDEYKEQLKLTYKEIESKKKPSSTFFKPHISFDEAHSDTILTEFIKVNK